MAKKRKSKNPKNYKRKKVIGKRQMLTSIKRFDGNVWHVNSNHRTKSIALKEAERQRKVYNMNARVVKAPKKTGYKWIVWIRSKY